MTTLAKTLWVLPVAGLLFGFAAFGASCDIDGVTPNCSPEGGDCVTEPGDAYPAPDSGTE
jgi:hypothetical protein